MTDNEQAKSYQFEDGTFSFWTAVRNTGGLETGAIFRVRADRTPAERAAEKLTAYPYESLRPANEREIGIWMESHPTRRPIGESV